MSLVQGLVQLANESPDGDIAVHPRDFIETSAALSSAIKNIAATVKSLEEATCSSFKALEACYRADGQVVLGPIDANIAGLESTIKGIAAHLQQYRAHLAASVGFVHNAALPVLRLPSEIFSLIVNEVAHTWKPEYASLGWIKVAHVCTAWRHAVIAHKYLWAREVGAFSSPDSFRTMLLHAQQAPLTIKNPWAENKYEDSESLPDHYWHAISRVRGALKLRLSLTIEDIEQLAQMFYDYSDYGFKLESLWLTTSQEDFSTRTHLPMASMSSLHKIYFHNLFIPFHAPELVSLSVGSWLDGAFLSVPSDQFLQALETCHSLASLCLVAWAPWTLTDETLWNVELPCLRTLMLVYPRDCTPLIALLEHLELPKLAYLVLEDEDRPVEAALTTTVILALLSEKYDQPFASGISRMSIEAEIDSPPRYNCFRVRLDDGHLSGMQSNFCLAEPDGPPDTRTGIHLEYNAVHANENEVALTLINTFLNTMISEWLQLRTVSRSASAIESFYINIHLESQTGEPDWSSVLQPLADVKVLYIPCFSNSTAPSHGNDLLSALSKVDSDGAMLLPQLHTILCADTKILTPSVEPDDQTEERAKVINAIRVLLSARAAHKTPLACMKYGSTVETMEMSESFRQADVVLHEMVSLYLHSNV